MKAPSHGAALRARADRPGGWPHVQPPLALRCCELKWAVQARVCHQPFFHLKDCTRACVVGHRSSSSPSRTTITPEDEEAVRYRKDQWASKQGVLAAGRQRGRGAAAPHAATRSPHGHGRGARTGESAVRAPLRTNYISGGYVRCCAAPVRISSRCAVSREPGRAWLHLAPLAICHRLHSRACAYQSARQSARVLACAAPLARLREVGRTADLGVRALPS